MDNDAIPPFNVPPPPVTPPPVIAPPTPPRPRKSRGWMIFALALLVLLAVSVLFNIGNVFQSVVHVQGLQVHRFAGPRLEETLVEDNNTSAKIAVVNIDGIITSREMDQSGYNMVDVVKAQLKRAKEDHKVKAVILKVDSPGGEVLASDDISKAITEFQKQSCKPVIASMGSLAASGGYYVSAPCQWIVANELTITGSIGVIMSTWNYRGLMNKVGLQPFTFKSGKFKDMLNGSREPGEITPEEKDMVQKLINETYDKFKSVVAEGRRYAHDKNKSEGQALARDWEDYADGRVLSGKEAQQFGFVDELGDFDDAADRAKEIVGIHDANLVEYRVRYDLSDFFRMFGKSDAHGVKVDLGVEFPKLEAGRLYFLSPTYLH
ncbi:MAG: signal peptide peptidase SppA [Verrucomicrobia bacterium]|jgi:protease-4|nr:signal peptide peptidase SppA [Verrucomicrobiota bacterium]